MRYGILVVNKGLFINGCKKVIKYVQNVHQEIRFQKVREERLEDTFVMIVKHHLAVKDDQKSFNKLYLKSIF
ncbi:MAG: Unknown protein [uncultured Campylobacterales bacterium]|uniref:Uncharacterized protein n=1 Tax=uncultured Campylobacterales bacterium TaxID=352960 RepID=A0A6S6SP79_9BACT|nr:MAG: Unknown protein [uncultured Campylobacterales bacterium]